MLKPLFQKLVVAVNGSEQSMNAALYGILMSKLYHCSLKVVCVIDTNTLKQLTMSNFLIPEESARYEKNLENDGSRYLSYIESLAKQKGVKIDCEVRKGSVWSEIIVAAEEYKADVILIGGKKHGVSSMRSVIKRDSLSATNSEIIGSANCNVLVVRQNDIDKLFKIS